MNDAVVVGPTRPTGGGGGGGGMKSGGATGAAGRTNGTTGGGAGAAARCGARASRSRTLAISVSGSNGFASEPS